MDAVLDGLRLGHRRGTRRTRAPPGPAGPSNGRLRSQGHGCGVEGERVHRSVCTSMWTRCLSVFSSGTEADRDCPSPRTSPSTRPITSPVSSACSVRRTSSRSPTPRTDPQLATEWAVSMHSSLNFVTPVFPSCRRRFRTGNLLAMSPQPRDSSLPEDQHAWGFGLATVTDDGTVLDTWFPAPELGEAPGGNRSRVDHGAGRQAPRATRAHRRGDGRRSTSPSRPPTPATPTCDCTCSATASSARTR